MQLNDERIYRIARSKNCLSMPKSAKKGPILISKLFRKYFKKYFPRLAQSKLVTGSLMMFTGTIVGNVGNYFYHLLMGRMLGPKGYGTLQSVISLLYLLSIFIGTLSLTTTKFVATLKGKKDLKGISWLFHYFNQRLFLLGGGVFLVIFVISPLIVSFLRLDSAVPIYFLGILFSISFPSSVNRAILQGLLRFKQMVKAHVGETVSKVVGGIILVSLGFYVNGAVLALVLAALVGYFLSILFLRSLKRLVPKKPDFNKKTFLKFALPVLFFQFSFTSLYTTDIVLVKHYFSSYEAGLYGALSVLGKIIFFATSSISLVMFPMIAKRHGQGRDSRRLLFFSLVVVFSISFGGVVIYCLFPNLMISLLFGKEFLVAAPLLGWMAIFIAIYSLAFLLVNFFLSVDKTKAVFLPIATALMQVIFIHFFHRSLLEVIRVSIIISSLLLLGLVLYYSYEQTKDSFCYRSRL